MKHRIKVLSVTAIAAMLLALTPSSPASERHFEIHRALEALRSARAHMFEARNDFGGHKADAIRATDEAIHQLEICERFDN